MQGPLRFSLSHPLAGNLSRNTMPGRDFSPWSFELHHFADSLSSRVAWLLCRCRCTCGSSLTWLASRCNQFEGERDPTKHLGNCQSICIQSIIATSIRQNKNSDFSLDKQLPITTEPEPMKKSAGGLRGYLDD